MDVIKILLFIVWCSGITGVYIQDNGYKDTVLSFSEKALGGSFDLPKLKDVLKNASEILFHATRRRSYFEEFTFVLPATWTNEEVCDELVTVAPKNIDIFTDSQIVSSLTAQHSKGCGEKGDIIYLPRDWLKGDIEDLAWQFVQQWSTYRYGVFSEDPERPGSCISDFTSSKWSPTGCYNIDLDEQVQSNENGLPQCDFPPDFSKRDDLRSSIMFSANSSKLLDFCDGSESFPHNPIAPTLHNRICERNPVWSIVKSTEDFLYGRNLPMKSEKPPKSPTFRCFKESKMHLTIMVQDTDTEARSEIRYALFYFLSIIEPTEYSVTLGTFSADTNSEDLDSVDLNLEDKDKLKAILESKVTLNKEVQNTCLACGLEKAYKISKKSKNSPRTIVVLSRESSLEKSEISDLINIIQDDTNVTLHFLFLEDTTKDIISSSLADAVHDRKGRIFRVKNHPVYMLTELTLALLEASKNVLHVEDKILVVHKQEYVNVTSTISDTFVIPRNTKGKLLYTMQFKKRGDIKSINNDCSIADDDLQSPICGSQIALTAEQNSKKIWNYSFRYAAGSKGTTCSSLALLKLESSSEIPFRIKGWFNKNKITPGLNVLKIYAEVYGRLAKIVLVEAIISGPGLTVHRLELRDNGNGDPDIKEKDHIYSRYFTSFTQKGTYIVSIYAKALEIAHGSLFSKEKDTGRNLTQTKIIGTFRVMQSPPKEDMLPPNRVTDLMVTSINSMDRIVELQWTAPGGNYDDGKAIEYKIYITDDWRDLQENILNKISLSTLNASDIDPKINGNKEVEKFLLPNSFQPVICYIALKASDKSGNEGKLSNIVQVVLISDVNNLIKNETDNNTETITSNLKKNTELSNYNIYLISGLVLGILILIIVLNILIWILCFRKYKNKTKSLYERDSKLSTDGNDINSDENILRSEQENMHTKRRMDEVTKIKQDLIHENCTTQNPLQLYSTVQKRRTNQESSFSLENLRTQHSQNQNERDLGFV